VDVLFVSVVSVWIVGFEFCAQLIIERLKIVDSENLSRLLKDDFMFFSSDSYECSFAKSIPSID